MLQRISRAALAVLLLASIASALAHGDDHEMDMNMDMDHMDMGASHENAQPENGDDSPMSYFAYGQYTGWIVAHIALMVVAWCFVLPTGMASAPFASRQVAHQKLTHSSYYVERRTVPHGAAVAIHFPRGERGRFVRRYCLQQPNSRSL